MINQLGQAERIAEKRALWFGGDTDIEVDFADPDTGPPDGVKELDRGEAIGGMAEIFAPWLDDSDAGENCVVDSFGDIEHAMHQVKTLFFGERERAAAVGPGHDFPMPDAAHVATDDRFHEVCGEALQIYRVADPVPHPVRRAVAGHINERPADDEQAIFNGPFHELVEAVPVVFATDLFEAAPAGIELNGVEGGEVFFFGFGDLGQR